MSIAFLPCQPVRVRTVRNIHRTTSIVAVLDERSRTRVERRTWTPSTWRDRRALQQPSYPDIEALTKVETQLERLPPLVDIQELRTLKKQLAAACTGNAFVLQGGDCAEDLNESEEGVTDTVRALFKMAVVLMWGSQQQVVKIGRLGGQYAKPRSSHVEVRNGQQLPTYRGEIVNGSQFTAEARVPDPYRMLLAYNRSAGTTNLVRALASGGFADLKRVRHWGLDWSRNSKKGHEYMMTAERIAEAIQFMEVCGMNKTSPVMTSTDVYTSHEGLLLPYEQALVSQDPLTGEYYAGSGHFIWIGERTRHVDDAHVEFARGISNRTCAASFYHCAVHAELDTLKFVHLFDCFEKQ